MTYNVPYSFVPGTKAKADEVNANFVDVLDKISNVDSKYDEMVQQINSNLEEKLDCDLTNFSESGQALFDEKANADDIDGTWVTKDVSVVDNASITAGATKTYSLSSSLPNDNNVYELIFFAGVNAIAKSGNYANIQIKTSLCGYLPIGRFSGAEVGDANPVNIVIGTDRKLYVHSPDSQKGEMTVVIKLRAYRKVR
ncbi:hypothetical protein IJ541_10260 [bacterium]|nr:hypothetical protein [bacterium]